MRIKLSRALIRRHELAWSLVCFSLLLCDLMAAAQSRPAQVSKPIKLAVKTDARSYAVGAKANVEVTIQNANNKPAKAAKDYIIEIELRSPLFKKKMQDTIKTGESSKKFEFPLDKAGIFEIHVWHLAKIPELRSGDTFIQVRPVLQRRISPGASLPGLNEQFAGMGMMAFSALPQRVSDQGTFLVLKNSPQRTLLADGKDAATIHVFFYSAVGTASNDIRIRLFNSGGKLEPPQNNALVIRKDEDYTSATLTSDKVGAVTVEYLGSTPNFNTQGDSRLQIKFGPPITQVDLNASPPSLSLVDQSDLIVRLLDESGKPIATDTSRQISFAIERGRGEIEKKELEIPAGRAEGRTSFLPTWIGEVEISAATPDLQPATLPIPLKVSPPIMPLSLSALGGLAGGLIAFWVGQRSKWWRIIVGLIAGFVLYWAFVFGVLNFVPRAIVLNPLSAFALSTLGGWLGTEVFAQILKRFGLSNDTK